MGSFGTTMTLPKDTEAVQKPPSNPPQAEAMPQAITATQRVPHPYFTQRSMKQLGIFFAGAGFLSLATLITRRSIARKFKATVPKFYIPSNHPVNKIDGENSLMAAEALSLATLNVIGFAIMMTGGLSWALDISKIDDLRARTRKHLGPGGGRTDEEAEREVEEWVAKVLLRREKLDEQETKGNGD